MKQRLTFEDGLEADVRVTIEHEIPTDEIKHILDRVVDGALTIIVVATVSGIIKKFL